MLNNDIPTVLNATSGPLDVLARMAREQPPHVTFWVREDLVFVPDAFTLSEIDEMRDDLETFSLEDCVAYLPCLIAGFKLNLSHDQWQGRNKSLERQCGSLSWDTHSYGETGIID